MCTRTHTLALAAALGFLAVFLVGSRPNVCVFEDVGVLDEGFEDHDDSSSVVLLAVLDALRYDSVLDSEVKCSTPMCELINKEVGNEVSVTHAVGWASSPTYTRYGVMRLLGAQPVLTDLVNLIPSEIPPLVRTIKEANSNITIHFSGDPAWVSLLGNDADCVDIDDYVLQASHEFGNAREADEKAFMFLDNVLHDIKHVNNTNLSANNSQKHLIILHFASLDEIGHIHGPKSEQAEEALYWLIEGLLSRGAGRDYTTIITSDHGMGLDKKHGGDSIDERKIPVILLDKNYKLPENAEMCQENVANIIVKLLDNENKEIQKVFDINKNSTGINENNQENYIKFLQICLEFQIFLFFIYSYRLVNEIDIEYKKNKKNILNRTLLKYLCNLICDILVSFGYCYRNMDYIKLIWSIFTNINNSNNSNSKKKKKNKVHIIRIICASTISSFFILKIKNVYLTIVIYIISSVFLNHYNSLIKGSYKRDSCSFDAYVYKCIIHWLITRKYILSDIILLMTISLSNNCNENSSWLCSPLDYFAFYSLEHETTFRDIDLDILNSFTGDGKVSVPFACLLVIYTTFFHTIQNTNNTYSHASLSLVLEQFSVCTQLTLNSFSILFFQSKGVDPYNELFPRLVFKIFILLILTTRELFYSLIKKVVNSINNKRIQNSLDEAIHLAEKNSIIQQY